VSNRTLIYIIAGSIVLTLGVSVVLYLVMRGVQYAAPKAREPNWFRRLRDSKYGFLIPAVAAPLFYVVAVVIALPAFVGGSRLIHLLDALPMVGMFAFFPLLHRARVPVGGLLCTRCKYNVESLSPAIPEGQSKRPVHDAVCPECGSQFGWPGGTISEHFQWRPRRIILCSLLLLPLLIKFGSIPIAGLLWWNSTIRKMVSTDALISDVTTSRSFTNASWDELSRRELTAEQDHRIATRLLSPPPRSYFSSDERRWLSTSIAARAINTELITPWINRVVIVSQYPSQADRRVQIKFDTAYLLPLNDMSATLQIVTNPPTPQTPLTIKMAGSEPFSAYWLGEVPEAATQVWVVVAIHLPGDVVGGDPSGESIEKSANTLYFTRIPILPQPAVLDAAPVLPAAPGIPQPSHQPAPQPSAQPAPSPNR
jgi:hypothetical protein